MRVYLDTSAISHLQADDTPDKMADTLAFWELLKCGQYIAVISDVTIEELTKCPEPKQSSLFAFISELKYQKTDETVESLKLAESYIKYGVLTQKSYDDCRHIAIATLSNCKIIASWNFKHFVNIKTINKV